MVQTDLMQTLNTIFGAWWVILVIWYKPPNSDMEYMIFNVHISVSLHAHPAVVGPVEGGGGGSSLLSRRRFGS